MMELFVTPDRRAFPAPRNVPASHSARDLLQDESRSHRGCHRTERSPCLWTGPNSMLDEAARAQDPAVVLLANAILIETLFKGEGGFHVW